VFGVEVRARRPGRDGDDSAQGGREFDGKSLRRRPTSGLPGYAVPLFVRVVGTGAHVDVQEPEGRSAQGGYGSDVAIRSTCWPAATRLRAFYDGYPEEVKAARSRSSDFGALIHAERVVRFRDIADRCMSGTSLTPE